MKKRTMHILKTTTLSGSMLLVCFSFIHAQDLSKIGKAPPIKVTGGANVTGIFYDAKGIPNRRDPLTYFLNANLNFDVYGMSIPLSFSYTNQQGAFTQPFNRLSLSPSYKWIKTTIGFGNFSWSPYTLGGHTFYGGGVELTPGNWNIGLMYGRLNKAVQPDSLSSEPAVPVFDRFGYGVKIGYQTGGYGIKLSVFKAKDKLKSLNYLPDSLQVLPGENLSISLSGTAVIFENLTFTGEIATSGYTRDLTVTEENSSRDALNRLDGLFNTNGSTEFFNAYNAKLNWQQEFYAINVGYERIDPGYETMGAYFFNNDLENITIGPSVRLLQSKLNLAANVGIQQNNLNKQASTENKRVVANVNATYAHSKKWNFTGNYSNFTTFTNIRPQVDPFFQNDPIANALDTLNFYQVSSNAGASAAYNFGTKTNRQTVFFTGSYQTTANEQTSTNPNVGTLDKSQTIFYNSNMAYRVQNTSGGYGYSVSINLNRSELAEISSQAFGPTISVNKSFLEKKLRALFAATYNHVTANSAISNRVVSLRLNGSYSPAKSHAISVNLSWINKLTSINTETPFNELTGTINYGYNF
ncbi:MAG: hypothetical protein L3J06_07995 [Cyclobacteriaceae bacterium]|nr:hypothetical protein [Cyclobacteriaceae bacterium]